ncbi:MAG: hypothetical protein KIT14_08590 [bacterium]|nr:hypothetical protein [bacterium]
MATRMPDGGLLVSVSGSLLSSPPPTNPILRSPATSTAVAAMVLALDSALPGSLTLDLPGEADVTIPGTAATIGGSLKVRGGAAAAQTVRIGLAGEPVTIKRDATVDLGGAFDQLVMGEDFHAARSLSLEGIDDLDAGTVQVDRSLKIDSTRDGDAVDVKVSHLEVGTSFTFRSAARAYLYVGQGSVGRNTTIDFSAGDIATGYAFFSTGGNSLTASSRAGLSTFLGLGRYGLATVKGSVTVTMLGAAPNSSSRRRARGDHIEERGSEHASTYLHAITPLPFGAAQRGEGDPGRPSTVRPQSSLGFPVR